MSENAKAGCSPHTIALRTLASHPSVQKVSLLLGDEAALYCVGGAVRDALTGVSSSDIDLSTALCPATVRHRLTDAGIRVIDTGVAHGTVTALVDDHAIEITTFRAPGVRDSHEFSETIEEDLSGRDFTINALALGVRDGVLVDPFGGVNDIQSKMLRTVGEAEIRFREDPLRILRMVRFGSASGRVVDETVLQAAAKLAPLLDAVSPERIKDELIKIVCGAEPAAALRIMVQTGICSVILPELLPAVGFEQNKWHTEDVFEHTCTVIDAAAPDPLVRLASLFHDLGKPHTLSVDDNGERHFYQHEVVSREIAERVLTRLKCSKAMINSVTTLVGLHMRPLSVGPSGVRRVLRDVGPHLAEWLLLKQADRSPSVIDEEFHAELASFQKKVAAERDSRQDPSYGVLAINGKDIMAAGVPEGPDVGRILAVLNDELIEDPEKNVREYLLERVKELS